MTGDDKDDLLVKSESVKNLLGRQQESKGALAFLRSRETQLGVLSMVLLVFQGTALSLVLRYSRHALQALRSLFFLTLVSYAQCKSMTNGYPACTLEYSSLLIKKYMVPVWYALRTMSSIITIISILARGHFATDSHKTALHISIAHEHEH